MHLLDLPSELLVLVLKQSLRSHHQDKEALKANLPLLAICSAIRQLSLPLAYRRLFLSHESVSASEAGAADASPDDQSRAKVVTNMDLVATAGVTHMVREVSTGVSYIKRCSPAFLAITAKMRTAAPAWAKVNSLTISTAPTNPLARPDNGEMRNDRSVMRAVGDALAELMPGLCQLSCEDLQRHPVIGEMCGRVVGHVAGRLLKVVSNIPVFLPSGCRLDVARDLRICGSSAAGWRPPRISADTIERLDMVGWSDDKLRTFIDTNSSNIDHAINFPKLNSIAFWPTRYHAVGLATEDVSQYRHCLHLPALKKLDISCDSSECFLWNSAVLPARLDSLALEISGAACESIARTSLPRAKRLVIKVLSGGSDSANTLGAINRILTNAGGHKEKELAVMDAGIRMPPDSIACSDLTRLMLGVPTTVDELLEFLRTQPKLSSMKVVYLHIPEVHTDVPIPASDEDRLVAPLHTNLKSLEIRVVGDHVEQVRTIAVTKRLLLGLPALANFEASPLPKRPIANFAREYSHRYPNLASISLEILD